MIYTQEVLKRIYKKSQQIEYVYIVQWTRGMEKDTQTEKGLLEKDEQ